jgi:hypothetical protein
MKPVCFSVAFVCVSASVMWQPVLAQNSAPSSHLVFDDNFDGDIVINEVRVPKSGKAMYTYYEALGWRGTGAGYAGIQVHPRGHNFIFSIWDHKQHTAPIKAVFHGPGTETQGFGGEGTGLKSWNFKLGWKTDVWYTLIARNWPVGDHTHYGFWSRAGDTKQWTHLVTMDVAAKTAFKGGTDAFIEDWLNTGAKPRSTNLRGGWKRKTDGTWFPFGVGRYSVNYWDLEKGKRSYNFRENWDAGTRKDSTGDFYFMTAGGAKTKSTSKNPSLHKLKRKDKEPVYKKIEVQTATAKLRDGQLLVEWQTDPTTMPQFSYRIDVFDNKTGEGKRLATLAAKVPHARKAAIDVSSLKLTRAFVHLKCVDILDRSSETKVISASNVQ